MKIIANILCQILVFPSVLLYRLLRVFFEDRRIFPGFSQCYSLIPGIGGEFLRRAFYQWTLKQYGKNALVSFGTTFSTADVSLGENVYIGSFCLIGRCRIGKDTLVASRVSVLSGKRQHGIGDTETPIRDQQRNFEQVDIGEDCWIGEGAIIAASLGSHSVISSGSVVLEDVEEFSVMVGNPATLKRKRGVGGVEPSTNRPG